MAMAKKAEINMIVAVILALVVLVAGVMLLDTKLLKPGKAVLEKLGVIDIGTLTYDDQIPEKISPEAVAPGSTFEITPPSDWESFGKYSSGTFTKGPTGYGWSGKFESFCENKGVVESLLLGSDEQGSEICYLNVEQEELVSLLSNKEVAGIIHLEKKTYISTDRTDVKWFEDVNNNEAYDLDEDNLLTSEQFAAEITKYFYIEELKVS